MENKEDKSCYVVDMIQEYMKKCADGWHEWGYNTRDGGHGERPVGEQVCMHCGIKYSVFLNSIKQPLERIPEDINRSYGTKLSNEDIQNSLEKTPSLKELAKVEPLQDGEREDFDKRYEQFLYKQEYGYDTGQKLPYEIYIKTDELKEFILDLLSQSKKEWTFNMTELKRLKKLGEELFIMGYKYECKEIEVLEKIDRKLESLTNQKKDI